MPRTPLALAAALALPAAPPAAAEQPVVERDGYGRPTGTVERLTDGRLLLRNHYGRTEGTVERNVNDSFVRRDRYGRPAEPAPSSPPPLMPRSRPERR
jgi:hypothetical protein